MIGVVVMAYGTPGSSSPDEVEAYYTHIRRGRPPSAEELANLIARYESIGGTSPLRERTEAQRARLATALGPDYRVVLGLKHAAPFIEDAVLAFEDGVDRVVGLVLAPHYSRASVGEYAERLEKAAGGIPVTMIRSWHDLPELHEFLSAALLTELANLPTNTKVLFTAHSLPRRVLEGDPYEQELRASAKAIADRGGLAPWSDWSIAWQSAGRSPEEWQGPDVNAVIAELAATGKADGVLVCPQGFTSDHLEILYDLDVQARATATGAGLAFARTRSINDDPMVLDALAGRIRAA